MSFSDHQAKMQVNPYTYFFEGGEKPFWAWKTRWGNTRLLVLKFEPATRPGPYYGSPRAHWEEWKRHPPLGGDFDPFASPVRMAAAAAAARAASVWRAEPYHTFDRQPSFGTFNWELAPFVEGEPPPETATS